MAFYSVSVQDVKTVPKGQRACGAVSGEEKTSHEEKEQEDAV